LIELTKQVGETSLVGRTGGAVTLAVGMAKIFSALPGMKALMSYWYHFAIMFEALFILTTVDTGTRVARFILQEAVEGLRPKKTALSNVGRWTLNITCGVIVCVAWGYLLYNNDIATIWPMFGVANQLLAAIALAIGTSIILKTRRPVYALITFVPLVFVLATTATAGVMNLLQVYLPAGPRHSLPNALLTGSMLLMTAIITIEAARSWVRLIRQPMAELEAAEARLVERRLLLDDVRTGVGGDASGYSRYLAALARSTTAGVWLTGVQIGGRPGEVVIKGRALESALVPAYIAALNRQEPFAGRRVGELRVTAKEEPKPQANPPQPAAPTRYLEFSLSIPSREAS
jgi:hypothetical protein